MAVATLLIAGIPPTGELFKASTPKKPTWRYYVVLVLTIGSFYLGTLKDKNSESEKTLAATNAKKEQDKRDSIADVRTNESNAKIVSAFAVGLGRYQLKYDSSTNAIIKIVRDSLKTKIIVNDDPVIEFSAPPEWKTADMVKHENGYYTYKYILMSNDAGSTGFILTLNVVVLDSVGGYINLPDCTVLSEEYMLSKAEYAQNFYKVRDTFHYRYIYFWLRGSYKNVDRTKKFNLNVVFANNFNDNTSYICTGNTRQKIIDVVTKGRLTK